MNVKLFRFFKKRRDIFLFAVAFLLWLHLTHNIVIIDSSGDDCIVADGILALMVIVIISLLTVFIKTYIHPWVHRAYQDYKNA